MGAPTYLAADFLRALQQLMPRGKIWPRDDDATQTKLLAGFAQTYEREARAANFLLVDAFPATAEALLPEWEETLGLPDPCAGPSPTLQQRRAQVVARLTGRGGQSAAYFIGLAATLGYTVTITNFATFRAGRSRCGQPLGNSAWANTWAINAPLSTVEPFRAGVSAAGEPLASWGNTVLECELAARAPAHTILQFRYS